MLFCSVLWCSGCVNVSRSSIRSLDPVICENGVKFSLFVAREVEKLGSQLLSALACGSQRRCRRRKGHVFWQRTTKWRHRQSRTAQWINQAMFLESFLNSWAFALVLIRKALNSLKILHKSKISALVYLSQLDPWLEWRRVVPGVWGSSLALAIIVFCITFFKLLFMAAALAHMFDRLGLAHF